MKIFVAIPTSRFYQPFWESLSLFLIKAKDKYGILINVVSDMPVADARNRLVELFLESDCEYILFLDDDHEGHSVEMIDNLISANTFVCAIKCFTKVFPYNANLLYYSGRQEQEMKYEYRDMKSGFHEHDLVGFGMTLIKKEAFHKIEKPYFVSDPGTNYHEDNYFCDKLLSIGIRPIGCWDYTLSHQGVGEINSKELRDKQFQDIFDKLSKERPNFKPENILVVA